MNQARATLQVNLDPGQDLSCKRNVQRCVSANRLSFSKLFDDISFVLNVRRLCVVVDCIISAAKVCDSVISAACRRYVVAWWSCFAKIFFAAIKTFLWCLGLMIVPGKSYSRPRKIESRSQFQWALFHAKPCRLSDRDKSGCKLNLHHKGATLNFVKHQ